VCSNVQHVCFEMGLVLPVLSLKWFQLTNPSCYCLALCLSLCHTLCSVSSCVSVVKPVTVYPAAVHMATHCESEEDIVQCRGTYAYRVHVQCRGTYAYRVHVQYICRELSCHVYSVCTDVYVCSETGTDQGRSY
jgi:hypothetical protein